MQDLENETAAMRAVDGVRAVVAIGAGLVMLVVTAGLLWLGWQHLRDPVTALEREIGEVRVLHDSTYRHLTAAGEPRLYRDLTLSTASAGTVRITTSEPAAEAGVCPDDGLPVAFVLGGLRTGRESLDFIPAHGDNLLVSYQYPYDEQTWYREARLPQIPRIREAVLQVPAQVAAALRFLEEEGAGEGGAATGDSRGDRGTPGASHGARVRPLHPERRSLLGFSFGALFVPAVQHLSTEHGRPFRAVILGYGGADVPLLLRANLDLRPAVLRGGVAWLVATTIRPMEPALHLPHLTGDFLVIYGAEDEQIPARSTERLVELTPEPKEVVRLQAAHMGPGQDQVNEEVVRVAREWLVRRGHIEPGPEPPGGGMAGSAEAGGRRP